MNVCIKNKRVLITGGGAGIGAVIAETFAADGAKVCVTDINSAAISALSSNSMYSGIACDCSNLAQSNTAFDQAIERLDGLDVLINNVGVKGPTTTIDKADPTEWTDSIAINIDSHFHMSRRAAQLFRRQRSGSMIFMSSVAGRLGFPNRSAYATAKWGLIGLTQSLAMELGPFNVRVNAILPGMVEGERNERVLKDAAKEANISIEEMRKRTVQTISMRTGVKPIEVSSLIQFLISDRAPHISGQAIGVCGNYETLADS